MKFRFRACNASRFGRYLVEKGTALVTVNESNRASEGAGEEKFVGEGKIAEKVLSSFRSFAIDTVTSNGQINSPRIVFVNSSPSAIYRDRSQQQY